MSKVIPSFSLLLLALMMPAAGLGQAAAPAATAEPLQGRVLLGGDPVPAAEVELHRVTQAESGVVETTSSDASGAFRFELPPPETEGFTVFFATAWHAGVRYFGPPLHETDERTGYEIAVYDTTSAPAEPLRIARRDLVMMPQNDGSWEVNEVVRLSNTNSQAIVSASGMPTATISIPAEAAQFEATDGDSPADQLQRMDDRLLLLMPFTPGEHEIYMRYRLPSRPNQLELGMAAADDSLNVYVRQPAPALTVAGLVPTDLVNVDGERFIQYSADGSLQRLRVEWPSSGLPVSPITLAVVLSVLVLGAGAWVALRNRPT